MKREQILIAAFAFVSVLTAAQVANAQGRAQGAFLERASSLLVIPPAEWRDNRFSETTLMAGVGRNGDQATDQDMVPAQWREDRFSATAPVVEAGRKEGRLAVQDKDMIPAQWREDRFSAMTPMACIGSEGVLNQMQLVISGAC